MKAFYNEFDPYCGAWLRSLIAGGHLEQGTVDERSILELTAKDCADRSHFFAGIGGWPLALALAGWPRGLDVWTGSCPCQPFSGAGKRKGFDDERHLWPTWFRLIEERRPRFVFGEQVASPDGYRWLDAVIDDLESASYATWAADLAAASVGAPHIRQRLFFVAVADSQRFEGECVQLRKRRKGKSVSEARRSGEACVVADGENVRRHERQDLEERWRQTGERSGRVRVVGNSDQARGDQERQQTRRVADGSRSAGAARVFVGQASRQASPWGDIEWIPCLDGKIRPAQPGIFPLAYGSTGRVGRLRAYGNAIVPKVAATFVRAVMDVCLR